MNEALAKLQEIGAQKIYERTHIPVDHVQAILHESYDGLSKIQFIGFLSILEREYGLDLKSVKLKGIAYYDDSRRAETQSIFVSATTKKNNSTLYIIIAIVVFLVFLFTFYGNSKENAQAVNTENEIIQKVKEQVVEEINDSNLSENNVTAVDEIEEQAPALQEIEKSFVIKTQKKLWIGYIELDSNKKNQTVFSKELSLDPNTDWLITLGHGYVDFEINSKEYNFKTEASLKFLYKDGELSQISLTEFKRLNRGYVW